MNYQETLEYLFKMLPMYQRIGTQAFKKDLTNIIALCKSLGDPQKEFKSIHIAGTNGKGSTSHITASILQEAGYKVGLYTSPHLIDFRERIRIDGEMVSEEFVCAFTESISEQIERIRPSFFEITVAMAFEAFKRQRVDVAVIETGLGGRLDSTNIIEPVLTAITNIGMDHMDMLGDTLPQIASEKAGIIKAGIPIVIGEALDETKPVFEKFASEKHAPIIYAEEQTFEVRVSDLQGAFQYKNVRTAQTMIAELNKLGWNIVDENINAGISKVKTNTGLRGRWEKIQLEDSIVPIYCDTGHNVDGIRTVVDSLGSLAYDRLFIVFGAAEGKDLRTIIKLLPSDATYLLSKPDVPRGMPIEKLSSLFDEFAYSYKSFSTIPEAFEAALGDARETDTIFVGGSTFVVADLLRYLQHR